MHSIPVRSLRSGTTLVVVMAIALLLAVQIYIVMTYTMGGFRHVERVNAHVRAIYVGESAFSRILARLKTTRWEDRWFKAAPASETDVALAGGTYSSFVNTASEKPDKLVDVWIDARYDGSVSTMYYRVSYADDTLDFSAQVHPQFFTFLGPRDPNPISGLLPPSVVLIQDQIKKQKDNEPKAIAAIKGIGRAVDLPGAGAALGIDFPGPPMDETRAPGPPAMPQGAYLDGVRTSLVGLPPPPPPPPPPPAPAPPGAGTPEDFPDVIRTTLAAVPMPVDLPNREPFTFPTNARQVFGSTDRDGDGDDDDTSVKEEWKKAISEHRDRGFAHWMNKHVPTVLGRMAAHLDGGANPAEATKIRTVFTALVGYLTGLTVARGGPNLMLSMPLTPSGDEYMKVILDYRDWWTGAGGLRESNE